MKTPEQIRDMEFQKSAVGGYKQSDVELFLEEVASQIEILTKQKMDADRKLQEFSKKSPDAALSVTGIQNVLVSAQKVADQIVEDAKAQAEQITAEATLKLTEAELKAKDILGEAEDKAVLLGKTAETEATKIIAEAVENSEKLISTAKERVELEQKLYDNLKIEVADFKKKATAQIAAMLNLIEQLPDEIPFDIERAKEVLATDFNNPELLLQRAVAERIENEKAIIEEEVNKDELKESDLEQAVETEVEVSEEISSETDVAISNEDIAEATENQNDNDEVTDNLSSEEQPTTQHVKGHISFDDDDDDEPVLFFRKKKK